MRAKYFILTIAALVFAGISVQAQQNDVREGATLVLGQADAHGYDHIDFPRKNFIIKRGAVADFNRLQGMEVVVVGQTSRNGETWVTLERADGGKFFRFMPRVEARLDQAMEAGELSRS